MGGWETSALAEAFAFLRLPALDAGMQLIHVADDPANAARVTHALSGVLGLGRLSGPILPLRRRALQADPPPCLPAQQLCPDCPAAHRPRSGNYRAASVQAAGHCRFLPGEYVAALHTVAVRNA